MKFFSFFLILILFLSFVSAAPLANDSSDITINCNPDCSCATSTCAGSTCSDGCGGICDGTKSCAGGGSGGGSGSATKYQCNDKTDNDGDGLCDFNGCYINEVRLPRDPDCDNYYDNTESSEALLNTTEEVEEQPIDIITEPPANETNETAVVEVPQEEVEEPIITEPDEKEDYAFIISLSGILISLILLFFIIPWTLRKIRTIKLPMQIPVVRKPFVLKPIIPEQPKKLYPEIEALKAKMKIIDYDLIRLFKNTQDRFSEILDFRNNIKNKSSVLFRTYDALNKVEKRFRL